MLGQDAPQLGEAHPGFHANSEDREDQLLHAAGSAVQSGDDNVGGLRSVPLQAVLRKNSRPGE